MIWIKRNKESILDLFFALILFLGVFVLWLYSWNYIDTNIMEDRQGEFGDKFGAINSLFSGLAFAGIIFTILLQRKELSLQRKELIETRNELKRTASAQEKSEDALNRQAENLKITAKLTALSTLVEFYSETDIRTRYGMVISEVLAKQDFYVQRIEEILERKDSS